MGFYVYKMGIVGDNFWAIIPLLSGDFGPATIFPVWRAMPAAIPAMPQSPLDLWDNFPIFTVSADFFAAMIAPLL